MEILKIHRLSRREKIRLALAMISPLRCGGIHYDDQGIPRTRTGANWNEIVHDHEQQHRKQLDAFDILTDEEFELKYPTLELINED